MEDSEHYSEQEMQEHLEGQEEFEDSSRGNQEEEEDEGEYAEEELMDVYQSNEEYQNEQDDQYNEEGEEHQEEDDEENQEEYDKVEVMKYEKNDKETIQRNNKRSVFVTISEDEAEEMEVNGIPFFRDPITGIITIERQISGKVSTEELEDREDMQLKDEGEHLDELEVVGEQEDQQESKNDRDSDDKQSCNSKNNENEVIEVEEYDIDIKNVKEIQREERDLNQEHPTEFKIEENQTEQPNDLNSSGEFDQRNSSDLNHVELRNRNEEEQNIHSHIQEIEEVGDEQPNQVEEKVILIPQISNNYNRNNDSNHGSQIVKQSQNSLSQANFINKQNPNPGIKQQQNQSKQSPQQNQQKSKPQSNKQLHHKQSNQKQSFKSINIYRDIQKPSINNSTKASPSKLIQQQDNLINMYQNAINHQHEKQQRNQLLREQKEAQALSHCTFSPSITKKAQMLSQKQQNYMDITSKTQIFMQKKQLIAELAQQAAIVEESIHCTFQPQIINYHGDQTNESKDNMNNLSIYERQIQWQKSVEEKNQQRQIERSQELLCFTPKTNGNHKQPQLQKSTFEVDRRSPLMKQQQQSKQLQLSSTLSNGFVTSTKSGSPSFASYLAEKYQCFQNSKEKEQQESKDQTQDYSQQGYYQNSQQKSVKKVDRVDEDINRKQGNYYENNIKANYTKVNLKMENQLAQLSKQLFSKNSRLANDSETVKIGLNRSLSGYMQGQSRFSQQNELHSKSEKKETNIDQRYFKNDSKFFVQLSNFNDIIVQNNHYALSPQNHVQQSEYDFQLAKYVIAQNALNSAFSATQSQTSSNHNSQIFKNNSFKQSQQH